MSVALELQKSIYSALTGDATLMGKISGVFDYTPTSVNYPFVVIGDMTERDWSTNTFNGSENTITIHSWSRAEGKAEIKGFMKDIHRILHKSNLTVQGATKVVNMLFEFGTVLDDPDAVTYHGVQRFRMLIQEG